MAKSREEDSVIQRLIKCIRFITSSSEQKRIRGKYRLNDEGENDLIVPLDFWTTAYKDEGLLKGWKESTFRPVSYSFSSELFDDYDDRFMPIILKYLSEIGVEAKQASCYYNNSYDTIHNRIDDPDSFVLSEKLRLRLKNLKGFSFGKLTYLKLVKIPEYLYALFNIQERTFQRTELKRQMQDFVNSEMYNSAKKFCDRISSSDYSEKLLSAIAFDRSHYLCYSLKICWSMEHASSGTSEILFSSLGLVLLDQDYQKIGVLLFIAESKAGEMGMSFSEAVNRGRFHLASNGLGSWRLSIFPDDAKEQYIPTNKLNEW